jgi:MFS superfamily sulfate permease-like transporter
MLTSGAAVHAGARSRGAAFGAAALVAVGTLALGSLVARVPLAVIATLLLVVAVELAFVPARELLQRQRRQAEPAGRHSELIVVGVVCALLLGGDILIAVAGGFAAATVLAFVRMRAGLVRRQYDAGEAELPKDLRQRVESGAGGDIRVIELGQPLFFATAEAAVRVIERSAARIVVLDLLGAGGLDLTAAKALARCAAALEAGGRRLFVAGDAAGLEAELRPCKVSRSVASAIDQATPSAVPSPRKAPVGPAPDRPVSADLIEHAVSLLAPRIGPLARHVVRRAAEASTHRDQFALLAASHLDERVEREAFLVRIRTWREPVEEGR